MTMINEIDQKCSVCGKTSPQEVLLSTNTMGYPDLDLRPAPMQRDTMNTWIQECPHCGYVAGNLNQEIEISKDYLQSEEYQSCEGKDFKSPLAGKFYRNYLIAKQANNDEKCFFNLLHCAWACDDRNDENAQTIRRQAIPYLNRVIDDIEDKKNDYLVMKSDLLRRAGLFDQVLEEFENLTLGEEIHDKIIQFEIEKALKKDTECYTVEDVKKKRFR